MSKCVVILGPPGAGKSTQGKNLAQAIPGAYFISVGVLLRDAAKLGNTYGKRIASVIRVGKTVPSNLLGPILNKAIRINQGADPLIIDFAGTADQCKLLHRELAKYGYAVTAVIFLQVSVNILNDRLLMRGREDDHAALIAKRFELYQQEIMPVIGYYRDQNLLHVIQAGYSEKVVTNRILKILTVD